MLKIIVFSHRKWQHFEQESHIRQELLVLDPRSHEFNRMNLSVSLLPGAPLSTYHCQIF
jgi:hypothetical protein